MPVSRSPPARAVAPSSSRLRGRAASRRAAAGTCDQRAVGVELPRVAVVGEINLEPLVDHRACAAPDRAPETRLRCAGTGCAPSSRRTTSHTSGSPSFSKHQTRWCSRKRPRIERTRMFSDNAGHAGPQRARTAHDQVDLHAAAGRRVQRADHAAPRRARSSSRRCGQACLRARASSRGGSSRSRDGAS